MDAPANKLERYALDKWGDGYFHVSEAGRLLVQPDPKRNVTLDLYEVASEARDAGLHWPVLLRFKDILRHRVRALREAFAETSEQLGFEGGYTAVYPIKVNQQRSVIEEILRGGAGGAGLEAGSKPELLAVLSQIGKGGVVVCNGYKDREYIRLALIGRRMGLRVYIVIEKPSELDLVLAEAERMQVEPLLGVRVRLAAVATGRWQNSGGDKSKFGLSASQLLALVERLREHDALSWLKLLHSHIGSQIPNLRDIGTGLSEVCRYYSELRRLGAGIQVVDVGGGLGIDYEGTGTRHHCSINYGLRDYARAVLGALSRICGEEELPHPEVFTESGRALTAHHAALITNVIGRESAVEAAAPELPGVDAPGSLVALAREYRDSRRHSPLESYREALHLYEELLNDYDEGVIGLRERAMAERLFLAVSQQVQQQLRIGARSHRELLEQLNEKLAERIFVNFSVFQSLPDVWAIDQIFPVVPLHRLNEPAAVRGRVHDLTCDSDGCIDSYVEGDGIEATLALHQDDGQPYLLGVFLVGAYQEILGDMHNLFGDPNAVNIELTEDGGYRLSEPEHGDTVEEMLRYVHFDPERMLRAYRERLAAAELTPHQAEAYYMELAAGLRGYTYLED